LQDKPPRRERRHPKPTELSVGTDDLIRRRKLWPVTEAAELLGVTKTTLYRWEREGYISFVKVDGRTFVADAELDRFVARAEVASAQDRTA
jgi:excisionase family DNA binding protein